MKKDKNPLQYGIYTDHKIAYVIAVSPDSGIRVTGIRNIFSLPLRFAGETSSKTGMLGTTISRERKQQNKTYTDFRKFCKQVAGELKQVNQILLFGPADAKYELHKVIEAMPGLSKQYCVVKTTDKMNRADAAKFVKAYYQ